jgi:hypothetical protein
MQIQVTVKVSVALSRPPKADAQMWVLVSVPLESWQWERAESEAQLIAAQMAQSNPRVVMAVATQVIELEA